MKNAMLLFVSWKAYRYCKRQIELKRKKIAISFSHILCRMQLEKLFSYASDLEWNAIMEAIRGCYLRFEKKDKI